MKMTLDGIECWKKRNSKVQKLDRNRKKYVLPSDARDACGDCWEVERTQEEPAGGHEVDRVDEDQPLGRRDLGFVAVATPRVPDRRPGLVPGER